MKNTGLNVIIFVLVALFFSRNSAIAQDIHFSQILSMPVIINPANTGSSEEGLRIASGYRNQWAKLGIPFKTFYTSIDNRLIIKNHLLGIGAAIVHDQSSGNHLTAEKINLSISYSAFYKNNQIIFGIQPAYVFRKLSQGLTFGSQFDPVGETFNDNLPNQENGFRENSNYFDLNAGFLWKSKIKSLTPSAGVAFNHINKPVETFKNSNDTTSLPIKYTFHGKITIPITTEIDFTPCGLFGYTPGAREFIAGGIAGFIPPAGFISQVKKIYAMNLYRINPARNIDAIIIGGGVRFAKFDIGISYDLNVSSLRKATNFRGAFEISLVFINGNQKSKTLVEPCSIF